MELFKILGTIALEGKDQFNGDVDSATEEGRTLAGTLGKGLVTAGKVAGAALIAVGTAAVAGTMAIVKGAREVAAYGDHIDKMSQKIGISAQSYQEWDFIMGQCGMSVDQLQTGMKTLSTAAQNGNEAFEKLGITQSDLATLGTEELFNRTVDALAGMEAGTERTALATELFGRAATEMMPLLNQGAEGIEALRQQAIDYGLILTDETIAASAAFTDSLTLMSKTFNGLKYRMMAEFLPSLTLVTDGLAMLFKGDMSGLDVLNEGITSFVTKVTEIVPQMLEIGASILSTLASAILTNLPALISAGADIIMQLVSALIENLPMILSVGMDVLTTLAEGLSSGLPTLIPQMVEVVITIVNALIENAPLLLSAGLAIIGALLEGLIASVPTLIAAIPDMVTSLADTFSAEAAIFLAAGTEYVTMISDGISSAWDSVTTLVSTQWESIQSTVSSVVESISTTVSSTFENIKTSISDKIDAAKSTVETAISAIQGFFNFSWSWPHLPLPHIIYDLIEVPLLGSIPNPMTLSVSWYKNGGIMNNPTAFGINGNQLMVGGEAGAEAIAPIDLLQGYVSDAVRSQNAGIVEALEKVVDAINKLNSDMGGNLADALDGTSLSINQREFGRLVRGAI